MKQFTVRQALEATKGRFFGDEGALYSVISFVTSDSREVKSGALFVAFKGARVDGHDFMLKCLEAGAACCLSEREPGEGETPCIVVESTLAAMGRLAAWHRSRFDIPFVGITGSVGKTTTKEMISAVLSARFNTHKTEKNFNNELGVPQTILKTDDCHEVAVVEMGISDFGEMRRLTAMVRPNIAVMSIIGESHLEFLGDRAGVLRAKGEIFESMNENDLAVLNGDDDYLKSFYPPTRRVTYGFEPQNDFVAVKTENLGEAGTRVTIEHDDRQFDATIPAFGTHMVYAALAGVAVGAALGMTDDEIAEGIARYRTVGERARIIHTKHYTLVSDCYNANPSSCRAAFESLKTLSGRRVCVLGDMLELGEKTEEMHYQTGVRAAQSGVSLVLAAGKLSENTAKGARSMGTEAVWFESKQALMDGLKDFLREGDAVLIKASHSIGFEDITKYIEDTDI